MKEPLKAAVTTSISEVLETMFFMTIDPMEVPDWDSVMEDAAGERLFITRISYQGPLSGFFLLAVPESVLVVMTETFMGVDASEVSEPQLIGTISEAVNMVAGDTFSKFDEEAVFNLGIPELLTAEDLAAPEAPPGTEKIGYRIETPVGTIGLLLYYSV